MSSWRAVVVIGLNGSLYLFLSRVHWNKNNFDKIFLFSQVIAVSKSSDIVLMVLDASKVSVYLHSVLIANPCDEWM